MSYNEVFELASDFNFTMYVGNVSLFEEETLRRTFTPFGRIVEIRHFRDKGKDNFIIRMERSLRSCPSI